MQLEGSGRCQSHARQQEMPCWCLRLLLLLLKGPAGWLCYLLLLLLLPESLLRARLGLHALRQQAQQHNGGLPCCCMHP
jgi:hypothetical protein